MAQTVNTPSVPEEDQLKLQEVRHDERKREKPQTSPAVSARRLEFRTNCQRTRCVHFYSEIVELSHGEETNTHSAYGFSEKVSTVRRGFATIKISGTTFLF